MKAIGTFALVAVAAGVILWLAGCSGGGGLGNEQAAGPFRVTLSSLPQPPTPGSVTLTATVTKDGSPVRDAKVSVESSMPGMNMPGPSLDLSPSGDAYSSSMNMMEGEWEVKVSVSQGSDTGSATYHFDVK